MRPRTHRQQAEALAIERAVERLSGFAHWPARCMRLGLRPPDPDGGTLVPMLGQMLRLQPPSMEAVVRETGQPAMVVERLLALHYLLCEAPVVPEERWITFREFPGGAFYWQPFLARTIAPLIARTGNNADRLRERVSRFAGRVEPGPADALSFRFCGVGRIDLLLVYRTGDEECPASADVLFDGCARRVFGAEDAAALASRLCLGLL